MVHRQPNYLRHSLVLGDGPEYHATGLMLLEGWLIVLAVILAYCLRLRRTSATRQQAAGRR